MSDEIRLLFGKSTAVGSRKYNLSFFLLPPFHTVISPVKVQEGGGGGATPIWVFHQSTVFLIDAVIDRVNTVNQELFSPAFLTHPTAVLPRIRKKAISTCSTICLFVYYLGQDLAARATHFISDFGCVGVSPLPAVVLFFFFRDLPFSWQ